MTNNKERVVYQTMVALSKKDTDIAYKYQKKIYLESMRKILLKQVSKGLLLQRNAIKQGRWVILHTARYKVIYKNIYFYIKNREGGVPDRYNPPPSSNPRYRHRKAKGLELLKPQTLKKFTQLFII